MKRLHIKIMVWSAVLAALVSLLVFFLTNNVRWFGFGLSIPYFGGETLPKDTLVYGGATMAAGDASLANVKQIRIDWEAGNVYLSQKKGDGALRFHEKGANQGNNQMVHAVIGDTLHIRSREQVNRVWIGINFPQRKDLFLELPEGMDLQDVDISAAAADVSTKGLASHTIWVKTASGDVDMVGSKAENATVKSASGGVSVKESRIAALDVKNVSGDVYLQGSIQEINGKTVSGRFEVDSPRTLRDCAIKGVSGDVLLHLAGVTPPPFDFDSVSGKVKNEFSALGAHEAQSLAPAQGEQLRLRVKTVSGHLVLKRALEKEEYQGEEKKEQNKEQNSEKNREETPAA